MLLIHSLLACQNLPHAQNISRKQRTVEPLSGDDQLTMVQQSHKTQGNITRNRGYHVLSGEMK